MSRCRGPAVAALLVAALAAAGCGFGPGAGLGEVQLTVTKDYGAHTLLATRDHVTESDTVMRVLERNAKIATRYGGGFVQSIDGLEGGQEGGRPYDWLYYVNGVESPVGAADYGLNGGDAVWWDYRGWSAAIHVPAVVGSWPQPFTGGYEGHHRGVVVQCRGGGAACGRVRASLEREGVSPSRVTAGAIRVLVGTWPAVRDDPAVAQIEKGPSLSGVFAEFRRHRGGFDLWALDEAGDPVRRLGPTAGLVAATRRYEDPPVWVITGSGTAGVEAAAEMLDPHDLRNHYAVTVEGGRETALPLPAGE